MARDPKRKLQTLSEYAYLAEKEEREKHNVIAAIRASIADTPSRVAFIIMLILFPAMIALLFYLQNNSPRAIRAQAQLEREFQQIKPLPEAVAQDYGAGHKG